MTIELAPGARCYGYVRVSTDKQALGPESQRKKIEGLAASMGLTIDDWFQDAPVNGSEAISGSVPLTQRPAGRALNGTLRAGDHLFVAAMDRMFRSLPDAVSVMEELGKRGVAIHLCDNPGLDLSTPIGQMIFGILAVFAQFERRLIAQRTKDALAASRRRGTAIGGGVYPPPGCKFAIQWDSETKRDRRVLVEDKQERKVMAQIVAWRDDQGWGWEEIYRHMARQGFVSKYGREWSMSRIFRAYQMEHVHRAREAKEASASHQGAQP